ncbi:MAG TPA: hypothetical protein VH187_18670 [Scandinavium sp.]|jgi:hypothetical protein|uniref:hypothetical protein n=1 Tax=Scandinavium sp. TaxID=2830653 RepID=UPI002E3275C8|nr:hypothetical protein [Scandinavium sp.]HEX4503162.1 hypothetical protein [Scandinavium sp.]
MPSFADAIEATQDLGGAVSFPVRFIIEEAGSVFLYGTPVMINGTDGGVQAWDATVGAGHLIAGFAIQPAQNLATTGAGAPSGFGPITGAGSNVGSYAPPGDSFQPLAVVTPPMVPMTDGFNYFAVAAPTVVFRGRIGTSASAPIATTNQQVGIQYGLTKDTGNNFWYVDTSKTGAAAVAQIVGLDPLEPVGTIGGHVLFTIIAADAFGA